MGLIDNNHLNILNDPLQKHGGQDVKYLQGNYI